MAIVCRKTSRVCPSSIRSPSWSVRPSPTTSPLTLVRPAGAWFVEDVARAVASISAWRRATVGSPNRPTSARSSSPRAERPSRQQVRPALLAAPEDLDPGPAEDLLDQGERRARGPRRG